MTYRGKFLGKVDARPYAAACVEQGVRWLHDRARERKRRRELASIYDAIIARAAHLIRREP